MARLAMKPEIEGAAFVMRGAVREGNLAPREIRRRFSKARDSLRQPNRVIAIVRLLRRAAGDERNLAPAKGTIVKAQDACRLVEGLCGSAMARIALMASQGNTASTTSRTPRASSGSSVIACTIATSHARRAATPCAIMRPA